MNNIVHLNKINPEYQAFSDRQYGGKIRTEGKTQTADPKNKTQTEDCRLFLLTVIKTDPSVIQANRSASWYPVNFNATQVTLNNTQVCCVQLDLANGSK